MRANEINFPYPVLGMTGSILGDPARVSTVAHIPLKERIAEPYRWDFEVVINNQDILELISAGKAWYMCEVMCSATLLRKCVFSESPNFSVVLDRKSVNKRVEFSLYVVARERIPEYTNSAASTDYQEIGKFDIAKGAPLAVLNSYHWDADLCYEDLTSLRSILQIVENTANPNDEYVHLDTEGAYIKVELPKQQYKAFMDVASEPSAAGALHASLVLYALQGALAVFNREKTHRWERALDAMISRDDSFRDLELGNASDAPAIALRLLGNPFKRLCDALPAMVSRGAAALDVGMNEDDGEDE